MSYTWQYGTSLSTAPHTRPRIPSSVAPRWARYRAMAYVCRHCHTTFARGTAFRNHLRVHAAPAQAARTRFPGTELYDASEDPAHALEGEDDDDGGGAGGDGDEDPRRGTQPAAPAQPVPSVEEELKLRLCELKANGAAGRGLSEADMNNILRIVALARRANTESNELFGSCDELSRHMLELVARHPELTWYVADVCAPSFPTAPPAKVIYRRLEDMLTNMVRVLDIKWGFWGFKTTGGGDRIYAHPCGAELFEAVCKLLEGTGVWALALQLWSDKANLTKRGSKSYYPLSCVVLSVLFDFFREQWPDSAIAFLPQIDRSDVPASMTNREFMLYKAEIEAACLERVLFPVFAADHVFNCVDNKGVTRPVIAMLHSWVADFQEQLALAGLIGQTGCALCCVEGDALLPDPDKEDDAPLPRTAAGIASAVAVMRTAWAAGRVGEFDRVRSESRQQGYSPILLSLFQRGLAGKVVAAGLLRTMVPANALPFDTLHVFEEGATKRTINAIRRNVDRRFGITTGSWMTDTLCMRFEVTLRMAFIEQTKWPNPHMVFRGKSKAKKDIDGCSGLQACELRAVCQLLPCLLPGIMGEKQDDGSWLPCKPDEDYLTDFACAFVVYYMELKRYNRPRGHTARTLEMLAHLGDRFLRLVREHFLLDQTSGFALPKMHQGFGPHVPDTIRWLGSTDWLGTEWGENSVKTGHAAYEATNKQTDSAEEQMAAHLAKRAATRRAMEAAGLSVVPNGLGTRRTARREAESTGVNRLALETLHRVAVADFSADPLPAALADRPGMASFPSELTRFLQSENKPPESYVHLVNSAALSAKLAHHPDEYAGNVTQTVYAAQSLRGRRRLSFVALEGVGDHAEAEEWIAQLLLLFRLPDGTQLAYAQFLVLDYSRAGIGPLFGTPNCAPLVWERIGAKYSYVVTHLDKLIRREFVVPDLSDVFVPRRMAERHAAARAIKERRGWREDSESSDSAEISDTSDEDDDDVAHVPAEDGVHKRWPRWIRNPFVWGW